MKKIEHIGIAVKNIKTANDQYSKILSTTPYKEEEVESESVVTSFFKMGETKIELLQATDEQSAIARFINKRGEGIHHIAFEVNDIYQEMERFRSMGFQLLNDQPKRGADNKLICFIHPKEAHGVLIELCQSIDQKQ
jgi:methylmalonyl-CoA/ethylmalonyl-CoA epimerase